MPDSADARLDSAAVYFQNGEYAAAVSELLLAVRLLSRDGADVVSSVSAEAFDSPLFSVVRRVFSVFDTLPDFSGISAAMPDAGVLLPDHAATPSEMLDAVLEIYEEAGESIDEGAGDNADISVIRHLIALLSGQQSVRDLLFSDTGMYMSAASAASPYLTGFFLFSGEDIESSVKKADQMIYGPLQHLAELFYSLLTSSLTAGLLLLVIRRAIPVMRPSKTSTAVNAVMLAVSNIPVLIEGLRSVARELSHLRQIVRGDGAG